MLTARKDTAAPVNSAEHLTMLNRDGDDRPTFSKHYSHLLKSADRGFGPVVGGTAHGRTVDYAANSFVQGVQEHQAGSFKYENPEGEVEFHMRRSGSPPRSTLSTCESSLSKILRTQHVESTSRDAGAEAMHESAWEEGKSANIPPQYPKPHLNETSSQGLKDALPHGLPRVEMFKLSLRFLPVAYLQSHEQYSDERIEILKVSGTYNSEQLLEYIAQSTHMKQFEYFANRHPIPSYSTNVQKGTYGRTMDILTSAEVESLKATQAIVTGSTLWYVLERIKRYRTGHFEKCPAFLYHQRVFWKHSFQPGPEYVAQTESLGSQRTGQDRVFQPWVPLNANDDSLPPDQMSRGETMTSPYYVEKHNSALRSAATSFVTAVSSRTAGFFSARGDSLRNLQPPTSSSFAGLAQVTPWRMFLREQKLLPTPFEEQNWSGRGQHAEFSRNEKMVVPLQDQGHILGHSASAVVEVVRCKRITLARKTIRCNYRMKREDAAKEVKHLQKLNHAHVVRIIGTYVFERNRDLHILIYPVADYDLEAFMEYGVDPPSLKKFFTCLASTLAYLHKMLIKHMDIKPKNLLVRYNQPDHSPDREPKIYLADFGIARSYDSALDAETCSPTAFTRIYAAPEVVAQKTRGFKADIFSLGCVFAEMLSALAGSWEELIKVRERNNVDRSFQVNIDSVVEHVKRLPIRQSYIFWIPQDECISMFDADPDKRPSSEELAAFYGPHMRANGCCNAGADLLEATTIPSDRGELGV